MAVPAVYAAALDSRITRVVVENPPVSHWHGPAMMNVLRTTDFVEVAAMLAPRQLVFITPPPPQFDFARNIYQLQGRESEFRNASGLIEALEL